MDPVTFLVFLVVGIIVSLDVAGLTLTQSMEFASKQRSPFGWAVSNGLWHALVLCANIGIIAVFLDTGFLDSLKDLLLWLTNPLNFIFETFNNYLVKLFELLRDYVRPIFGIVTVCIVWYEYSEKVVSSPRLGDSAELRPGPAKILYDLLELGVNLYEWLVQRIPSGSVVQRIGRFISIGTSTPDKCATFLHSQAQAALVAVDMLALAALMNAMGYLDAPGRWIWLAVIVLMVVFIICWAVGTIGRNKFSAPVQCGGHHTVVRQWATITLRLAEPFLIFYFVLELMGFLIFERRVQSVGFVVGSMFLLYSLVKHHSLVKIVKATLPPTLPKFGHISCLDSVGSSDHRRRSCKKILKTLLRKICKVALWGIGLYLVGFAVWSCYEGLKDWISGGTLFLILSGIIFVAPVILVGRVRGSHLAKYKRNIEGFFLLLAHNISSILFIILALIAAAFFPIMDNLLSFSFPSAESPSLMCPRTLGLVPNHLRALQIVVVLVYLLTIGAFIWFLEKKQYVKLSAVTGGKLDANWRSDVCISSALIVSSVFFWCMIHVQAVFRQWYEAAIC